MSEAALIERTPARTALPVTVAVGHSSPIVAAGLAATLVKLPGYDVRLREISCASRSAGYRPSAQLIFGDSALLKCLREESTASVPAMPKTDAKFVLLTAGNEIDADAFKATGEIDECLSIECREEELFATAHRLIRFAGAATGAPATADNKLPAASLAASSADSRASPSTGAAGPAHSAAPSEGTGRTEGRGGLAPGALRRVREYIELNFSRKLPTGELAKIARLSPGHFNRAFRQSIRTSPHQYVTRQRVSFATRLLETTNRALAEIALDAGFADQSHFSRTYAAVTGETPSACRRRYR